MIKLIAETAWHHDGDFKFMSDLVDSIIERTSADIIKLHITLDLDEYMHISHPAYQFLKERLLSEKQWEELINRIRNSDKELMLLLNDKKALSFGVNFNPSLIEVHSVCLNDIFLLEEINLRIKSEVPIVLGVGGSTLYEIENAINTLESDNLVLMHGFQNYPTKYEDVNFNKINKLKQLYPEYKHGYADHTAWDEPNNVLITSLGAAVGMDYIEKHVTTVPGSDRTDWQAAIDIEEFNQIANNLKLLIQCNGDGALKLNNAELRYSIFGPNKKAAILTRDVVKDEKVNLEDIKFVRILDTTDLSQTEIIENIGRNYSKDLSEGSLLFRSDFI